MQKEYGRKANGKFLITGEYVVLRGAEALALPLRMGQRILMVPNPSEAVYWEGFAPGGKWLETAFHADSLEILAGADAEKSERLVNIIREIRKQAPDFLKGGTWVRTDLDFEPTFGMGSSSTLLALLCDAAGADAYPVLKHTFGGSGYDLACAFAEKPLLYTLRNDVAESRTVSFPAAIAKHVLFVYSGNKMVSSGEVKKFSSLSIPDAVIESFSALSHALLRTEDVPEFADIVTEHEQKMGELLGREPIQTRFPDFPGTLKSMGAWGGDFFMALCPDPAEARRYFAAKGFDPVFGYDEIVLGNA